MLTLSNPLTILRRLFQSRGLQIQVCSFVLTVMVASPAFAELRAFTNKEGRTVTAEAIGLDSKANEVTLRTADGRTFTLPINTLSLADQAFLAESRGELEVSSDPGGWQRVEVDLPLLDSRIDAPGIYGAFYRTGATRWTGELPAGAWISVTEVIKEHKGRYIGAPELLLRFDGTWKSLAITFREGLFYASFDGARPRLVGVTCGFVPAEEGGNQNVGVTYFDGIKTYEEQTRFLNSIFSELEKGDRICLQPATAMAEADLRRYREKIGSIIAHRDSTADYSKRIEEIGLLAFKTEPATSLQTLQTSPQLEFLSLGRLPAEPVLHLQTGLTTLDVERIESQDEINRIGGIGSLRFVKLKTLAPQNDAYNLNAWAALSNLAGLDINPNNARILAGSVSALTCLRTFRFDDREMGAGGNWMFPLENLRNVYWPTALGASELSEYVQGSKAGSNIRFVWSFNTVPVAHLPSLRALEQPGTSKEDSWTVTASDGGVYSRTGSRPYQWPAGGIGEAANLEYLAISGVNQEFINQLVAKKNPGSLKTLILEKLVDCVDLSDLKAFKNLRVLSIAYFFESVPGDPAFHLNEIDLTALKHLEVVEILPFYDYTGINPVVVWIGDVKHQRLPDDKNPPKMAPWR